MAFKTPPMNFMGLRMYMSHSLRIKVASMNTKVVTGLMSSYPWEVFNACIYFLISGYILSV